MSGILEHGIAVLDQCSMSEPRRSRRAARDVIDRVECLLDEIDAAWCEAVLGCGEGSIGHLSGMLASLQSMRLDASGTSASEAAATVAEVLELLHQYSSASYHAIATLSGGCSDESARSALATLRALPAELQESPAEDRPALSVALGCIVAHDTRSPETQLAACMAVLTLAVRCGADVASSSECVDGLLPLMNEYIDLVAASEELRKSDMLLGAAGWMLFVALRLR